MGFHNSDLPLKKDQGKMVKSALNTREKMMLQSTAQFCTRKSHSKRLSHPELQNTQLSSLC